MTYMHSAERTLILAAILTLATLPAGLAQEKAGENRATGIREGAIGANDALSIFVPASEEITKTWRVGTAGDLNLPLVGTVQAAGRTVQQFEELLNEKLRTYIHDPQAVVSIVEVRSQPVTVLGAVGTPGTLQLEGRKTLLDILMAVGGPRDSGPTLTLTRTAGQGAIPLPEAREEEGGKYSVATMNITDVLAASTPAANLIVRSQDVISVSPAVKAPPRLVQIIGEVTKPGAVELVTQESVSIVQAIAAAGGPTHTASLKKTIITHVNPEGVRTEIAQIDLTKILQGKVKDIELVAGDIVVVPTSQVKTYFDIVARTMVGSGSMVILTRF